MISSGVFSVEGEEDIAGEGKTYGIIRSTDIIRSANATGEGSGENEETEETEETEEEDMVSVLWLYTTAYLNALTQPDTELVSNKDE